MCKSIMDVHEGQKRVLGTFHHSVLPFLLSQGFSQNLGLFPPQLGWTLSSLSHLLSDPPRAVITGVHRTSGLVHGCWDPYD